MINNHDQHPYDLLCRAANLIRWNQRLLCCANDKPLELDADDIAGLYWTFENILEDIAEALKKLEDNAA